MSFRIRILHISDLHERVYLPWMDQFRKRTVQRGAAARCRVLGDSFYKTLAEIQSNYPVDLVCFTGDVADWGLSEEYDQAKKRILTILNAVSVPPTRFFAVPGNHDVQRKLANPDWTSMRNFARMNIDGLSKWMAEMTPPPPGAETSWRDNVLTRTSAFWKWLVEDMALDACNPLRNDHGLLGYRLSVSLPNIPFPVNVIGLDSAWLAGDDNDRGNLALTSHQLDALACDANGKPLPGFRLAMSHHPVADLVDGDRCRRLLAEQIDLHLHGHVHEPLVDLHEDPDKRLLSIAAGSLYEGDYGDRFVNGFHVIDAELSPTGEPLQYNVTFWGWSENGHWFQNAGVYERAKEGTLTWEPKSRYSASYCNHLVLSLDTPFNKLLFKEMLNWNDSLNAHIVPEFHEKDKNKSYRQYLNSFLRHEHSKWMFTIWPEDEVSVWEISDYRDIMTELRKRDKYIVCFESGLIWKEYSEHGVGMNNVFVITTQYANAVKKLLQCVKQNIFAKHRNLHIVAILGPVDSSAARERRKIFNEFMAKLYHWHGLHPYHAYRPACMVQQEYFWNNLMVDCARFDNIQTTYLSIPEWHREAATEVVLPLCPSLNHWTEGFHTVFLCGNDDIALGARDAVCGHFRDTYRAEDYSYIGFDGIGDMVAELANGEIYGATMKVQFSEMCKLAAKIVNNPNSFNTLAPDSIEAMLVSAFPG